MAGYNTTGIFAGGICEQVLSNLSNHISAGNLPQTQRTPVGYTECLLSPENMAGISIIPVKENEKRKQVRIKYLARAVESQINEAADITCTPDSFDDFCETTFDVDQIVSRTIGIDQDELRRVCPEGEADFITQDILAQFDAMARIINKNVLTTQSLNFGTNVATGNSATKAINVTTAATGNPLALGIQELKQDFFEQNQYAGTPKVVGQGNIARYMDTLDVACCNDGGTDLGALGNSFGMSFWLDTTIEGILGANQFAMLAPGTTQLVTLNLIDSLNIYEDPSGNANATISDPRIPGLTYDMTVIYDACIRQWTIRLELNYGLFNLPSDAFLNEDTLFGTNGTLRYTANTV